MEYLYTTENFKASKIDYSYSKFHGVSFVKAYFNYRSKFILCNEYADNEIDIGTIFYCNEKLINYISAKIFLTQFLEDTFESKKEYFDLLIKRFEVTKKIYSFYDSNLRPAKSHINNLSLDNYLAFSYTLTRVYEKTKNFKYLNSLIKVNDILCSAYIQLSQIERVVFSNIINKEIKYIKSNLTNFNIEIG